MRLIPALAVIASALALVVPGAAQTPSSPPAPTNLEVVATSEDSITIAWGPAQPGEFYGISEDKNSLVVGWGPSQDTRSAVTYTLSKNGSVVASGLTMTSYRLTGLNRKVRSFRSCVTAYNASGQASPPMCATWAR